MPSDRILEQICEDRDRLVFYHTEIPYNLNPEQIEDTLRFILVGIIHQVAENFRWALDVYGQMKAKKLLVPYEALKNAVFYGSKNQAHVHYGLFLGNIGICHGIKDGGDYFKSEEVKRRFENKIKIEEFAEISEELENMTGFRSGVNEHIYPYSDIIEVDTGEGVLYCVQYKRSLEKI